jgi:hypothetical protein
LLFQDCILRKTQKRVKWMLYGTLLLSSWNLIKRYPSRCPYKNNVWDFSFVKEFFSIVVPRLYFKKTQKESKMDALWNLIVVILESYQKISF